MDYDVKTKYLKIVLLLLGLFLVVGFYPLTLVWPSGWVWHEQGRSEYLEMIMAVYATLGVFLLIASRNPAGHISLIGFTIWSSIAHGGVMMFQALGNTQAHAGHLIGDVPALFIVAAVLGWLCPPALKFQSSE